MVFQQKGEAPPILSLGCTVEAAVVSPIASRPCAQIGLKLFRMLALGALTAGFLKAVLHMPRPSWVDTDIAVLGKITTQVVLQFFL